MRKIVASFSLALFAPSLAAQCFDTAFGTPLAAPGTLFGDFVFPIQPIGFAFPVGAATYTDVHVCDKGYVWLSNAGVPAPGGADFSATAAELASQSPRVAALWSDIQVLSSNNGMVYLKSTPTTCTITWENAQCYQATSGIFSMQMVLESSGAVKFLYGPGTTNASVATVPTWVVGVAGISPGLGAPLPAASDLSAGGATVDPTLFEEWITINTFDMANNGLQLVPANPGYAFVPLGAPANCAAVNLYGTGCVASQDSIYEEWTSAFDLSNTTITWLRTGSGYAILNSIPGTFMTPSATAINIAPLMLDGEQVVTLTSAMPVAGGTTTTLNVTTKGQIQVAATTQGFVDYTPTVAELLNDARTTFALWHDYDQTSVGSGLILFEEVAGVAYVTWNGVNSYFTSLPNTFQFQLDVASGNVTLVIGTMSGFASVDPGILGYSVGGVSPNPGATDFSAMSAATISDVGLAGLDLSANSSPSIGNAGFTLITSNVPPVVPLALQFFGSAVVNPGLDLTFLGMPGCYAYTNADLGSFAFPVVAGQGLFNFGIPNNPALIGASLSTQSVAFTLLTPFNLASSNGLEMVLGN